MDLTPPLSGLSGIMSDEVGDEMGDATREAAEKGSGDEDRWSKCGGGFSLDILWGYRPCPSAAVLWQQIQPFASHC
jgi:hypothetical protein